MKRSEDRNAGMYSGKPCDLCGGPTLGYPSGSIWCPAEDPHPGGHFVVRMAFDRPPTSIPRDAEKPRERTGPRVRKVAEIVAKVKAEKVADPYATGMDAFIGDKS